MKKISNIKILILLIGVIFIFLIFYVTTIISIGEGCDPPDKPAKVPVDAIWKGDCDGGYWVELVKLQKDKVRFRIYRDWNGDLIYDADFGYKDCNGFRLSKSNWDKCITGVVDGNNQMAISFNGFRCYLITKNIYYEENSSLKKIQTDFIKNFY